MTPFVNVLWPAAPAGGVSLESSATSSEDDLTSTHTVSLPASIADGDVVVIALNAGTSGSQWVEPTGWTLHSISTSGGHAAVLRRACDGSEGATLSVNTDDGAGTPTNSRSTHVAQRYSGVAVAEAAWFAIATDTSRTPPNVTPAWGEAENAWLAMLSASASNWNATAPTNYGDAGTAANGSSSASTRTKTILAHRILTATSEQPGAWGITDDTDMTAERVATIALRPAA